MIIYTSKRLTFMTFYPARRRKQKKKRKEKKKKQKR